MIVADVYIRKYNWHVQCYFAVDTYYVKDILNSLWLNGCNYETLDEVKDLFAHDRRNVGLTHSNPDERTSVLVTSITSNPEEFLNSLTHELCHLTVHMANEIGIDKNSEEFCYLAGDTARALYPYCKNLLCECCRRKLKQNL